MLKESNYLLIIFNQDKKTFRTFMDSRGGKGNDKKFNKIEKYINTNFLVKQNFHRNHDFRCKNIQMRHFPKMVTKLVDKLILMTYEHLKFFRNSLFKNTSLWFSFF